MRRLMLKAAAEVTKKELVDTLQKHEDRETPEQEAAESKEEESVEQRAGLHDEKNKAYAPKVAAARLNMVRHLKKNLPLYLAGTAAAGSLASAVGSNRTATVQAKRLKLEQSKVAGIMSSLKKLFTIQHNVAASKALPMEHTMKLDEKILHKLSPKELLTAGAALGGGIGFGHEFGKRIGKGRQRKQTGPRIAPMPGGAVIVE